MIADEPIGMLLFQRREEEVRLVGMVSGVVRVVHPHRPEHFHVVLVAELDHRLKAVGALVDQLLGDVARVWAECRTRSRTASAPCRPWCRA